MQQFKLVYDWDAIKDDLTNSKERIERVIGDKLLNNALAGTLETFDTRIQSAHKQNKQRLSLPTNTVCMDTVVNF